MGIEKHEFGEYVSVTNKIKDYSVMVQWLRERNIEFSYIGRVHDWATERYESHWNIPNGRDQMLFLLAWNTEPKI